MIKTEPISQQKLLGLDSYILELVRLYEDNAYPNKILLSGLKGVGKSTLAYHFINYVLSKNENNSYDLKNFEIHSNSKTFRTILNKSNTNLINLDINSDKKIIEISQIRKLIDDLNKSSFNNKPRFVLIDNIELLNVNSINALLKVLEEPNRNINFILIHNYKKTLPTLLSRCINYKINLSNKECKNILYHLLEDDLENLINNDLINYYFTPGNILNLVRFAEKNNLNLVEFDLKALLKIIIKENHYKTDPFIRYIIFDLIEFYFRKLNTSISKKISHKYSHYLKRFSDTKIYNLDEESIFMEFEDEILNG